MRATIRLAALGLVAGVGAAPADPPAAAPAPTAAVALSWAGPPAVRAGRPNRFTLTAANAGRAVAHRVTVQVKPPDGVTVAATDPPARVENGVHLWDIDRLEPGAARPLALTLVGDQRGDFTCQAWVTFTAAAGMTVAVQEPRLEVAFSGPATVPAGERLELAAVVTNTGNTPLRQVDFRVAFPDPTPVDLGDGRTATAIDSQAVQYHDLGPGESRSLPVKVRSGPPGDRRFAARAEAGDGVSAAAEATITVTGRRPTLRAEVRGPVAPVAAGEVATCEIHVTNAGPQTAERVAVACDLPPGLALVAAAGPTGHAVTVREAAPGQGGAAQRTRVEFDAAHALAPNVEAVFRVRVRRTAAADVRVTATVTAERLAAPVVAESPHR